MELNRNYWHALDKQAAQNVEVMAKDIGISHGAGDVLQGLKANIMAGASHVELGFMGKGKGSMGQGATTPEMFGKEVRDDIRQLAKLNEVTTSVHASVAAQGLSGFTEKGFSDQHQEETIEEIKRAIDFAADTTRGGPVTVHTQEFPRPIISAPQPKEGKEFKAYDEESKKAPVYLVDKKSGQILSLPRDTELNVPVYKDKEETMPEIDKNGEIVTHKRSYDYYLKEQDKLDKKYHKKFKERGISEEETPKKFTPPQLFYIEHMERQRERISAEERIRVHDMEHHKHNMENIKERKKLLEEGSDEEKKEIARQIIKQQTGKDVTQVNEEDINQTILLTNKQLKETEHIYNYYKDGAISFAKEKKDIEDQQKNLKTIEEFGIQKSAEGLAKAAIYAYDKEKSQHLENPLFIAPENIFPEGGYGSHPQELKEIVQKSREEMVNKLLADKKRGISESEAKKIAADHIKATFDIGHANTWRKFFSGSDEDFKKWMKKEVDELNKQGIIGHVHLSDNFGYFDEHLTPGQGNVPLKEFVQQMKEAGHKLPMIVEPGAQGEGRMYQAMTGAWRQLNSPIYRTYRWTDVEQSYFGRTASPNFIVGDYAPDQKEWTLYSGVPLE